MRCGARYAACVLFASLLPVLVESSCASMRPISEADFERVDPAENKTYRLTTNDRRVYEFKKFALTDSTLVILDVASFKAAPYAMDAVKGSVVSPVVIPRHDIASLERAERSMSSMAIGITAGVVMGSISVGSIVFAGWRMTGFD